MFIRLRPQKVWNTSGYIVQTGSRYSMQYLKGELLAEIEVDFGTVVSLYPESMAVRPQKNAPFRRATPEERQLIMGRIEGALKFMKEKYAIYEGRQLETNKRDSQ